MGNLKIILYTFEILLVTDVRFFVGDWYDILLGLDVVVVHIYVP